MAIEIYKEVEKEDKPTKVALVNDGGRIFLAVVDDSGTVMPYGYIASIDKAGLKLCGSFKGTTYGIAIRSGEYVAVEKE